MTDLFSGQEAPLADRMRPRTLAEFIGQRHLLGEGRLLRRAIEADRLTSSIFFGPPGCGKTTLASIIANSTKSAFVQLNAVTSGVADVRKVIADAQERRAYGQSTYLLLDECHRWSKAQSDSILPAIERGIIRFIGSTTENPMVSMTPAIVSRCRVFQFEPLTERDVLTAMRRAIDETNRRRAKQQAYNAAHGITPTTIVKPIKNTIEITKKASGRVDLKEIPDEIEKLKALMNVASRSLDFETAIKAIYDIFVITRL